MAFKLLALAALVAIVAAQTTGSSSGGAGGISVIVGDIMGKIGEKLVSIIELLGKLLTEDLEPVLITLVKELLRTVCYVLQLVNEILGGLGRKTLKIDTCAADFSFGVSGQPRGTTVSGSAGL